MKDKRQEDFKQSFDLLNKSAKEAARLLLQSQQEVNKMLDLSMKNATPEELKIVQNANFNIKKILKKAVKGENIDKEIEEYGELIKNDFNKK